MQDARQFTVTQIPAVSGKNRAGSEIPGRFKAGQSGNPNGRPKVPEERDIKALARTKTVVAFSKIVELINSDDERVALMAAKEIIERAYGKAPQHVEMDATIGFTKDFENFIRSLHSGATATVINGSLADEGS